MEVRRRRRALWVGYVTAATPFLIGCIWDLIFEHKVAKSAPAGWIVDSAPPYPIQFLIPIGFFGLLLFTISHLCVIVYRKLRGNKSANPMSDDEAV